ncbi:hypothetical protein [Microseira wollei]|uniref:hypothetical protein n=1 Tax=Microseira wollei TaxID=467598 RepID=UPI001CFE5D50|nr:hypothetical protein [Microseira wollei]
MPPAPLAIAPTLILAKNSQNRHSQMGKFNFFSGVKCSIFFIPRLKVVPASPRRRVWCVL